MKPFKNLSDTDASPEKNVNSKTGEGPELPIDVTDFECALCMR